MLWRALRQVERGFWIDVGAADPRSLSVTQAFSEIGWHGINIEPAERPFNLLRAERLRDINLQVAAGEHPGEIQLFVVGDDNGLTTTDAGIAAAHAARGYEIKTRTVAVRTLTEICASHAETPIHFLKVDVEGAERSVLAGADFERFRPWIVLVESTAPLSSVESYSDWERYLLDADYRFAYFDGLNRFYIAQEQAHLLQHFRTPPNVLDDYVRVGELTAWARADAAELKATEADTRRAAAETQAQAAERKVEAAERRAAVAEARCFRAVARADAADVETARALARAAQAEQNAAEAQARANAAEASVAGLISSTSWRVTRPLRSVAYRSQRLQRIARRVLHAERSHSPPEAGGTAAAPASLTSFRLLADDEIMALRAEASLRHSSPAQPKAQNPIG